MRRRSRIALSHLPHHVVQRGHNRRPVFITDKDRLDLDPCYLGLAATLERQQVRYREWVEVGSRESDLKFLCHAVQRHQLTGSEKFIHEVEQRTWGGCCIAAGADLDQTTRRGK